MPANEVPIHDLPEALVPASDLPGRESAAAPQKKTTFPGRAGAFLKGAATSIVGAPGDIEELAAQTIPKALGMKKGLYDASTVIGDKSKTFLPTSEQVRQTAESLGVPKTPEQYRPYEERGELAPAVAALPALARKGVGLLAGETSKIGEESARIAEKMGFKLAAPQVARASPTMQRGAAGTAKLNQKLANQYASTATGKAANFVDEPFLKGRLKDLGKQFDAVYQGKTFQIDPTAEAAIRHIAANEAAALGPSGVSVVRKAADDVLDHLETNPGTIPGDLLQKLRNALTAKAGSSGGQAAHEIYGLVDEIDASVARNHPQVAKALNELRPKYRATVVLEDLTRRGGIKRGDVSLAKLGDLLEGASIRRKADQEIDALGKIGRDNNLAAIWQKEGEAVGEEGQKAQSLLDAIGAGRLGRMITFPARTGAARSAQRFMNDPAATSALGRFIRGRFGGPANVVLPAGAAARAANPEGQ